MSFIVVESKRALTHSELAQLADCDPCLYERPEQAARACWPETDEELRSLAGRICSLQGAQVMRSDSCLITRLAGRSPFNPACSSECVTGDRR